MVRLQLRSVFYDRLTASTVAAVFFASLVVGRILSGSATAVPVSHEGTYVVERVGTDLTLFLTSGQPARLLGVQFPVQEDRDQLMHQALRFLQQEVAGRPVQLELDRTRIDNQRRTLAYVSVDGRLLNADMIRHGFGRRDRQVLLRSDRSAELQDAEEQARVAGRGLWSQR